jgi:hypothetical protein
VVEALQEHYVPVARRGNMGGVLLIVLARRDVAPFVRNVATSGENTGIAGEPQRSAALALGWHWAGLGWHWAGLGWAGLALGWDGMGWDGMGWSGMGWQLARACAAGELELALRGGFKCSSPASSRAAIQQCTPAC